MNDEEEPISLPEGTEGVIILNIESYGGGAKLWQPKKANSNWRGSFLHESDGEEDVNAIAFIGDIDYCLIWKVRKT